MLAAAAVFTFFPPKSWEAENTEDHILPAGNTYPAGIALLSEGQDAATGGTQKTSSETDAADEAGMDFREEMRQWVMMISTLAKAFNENFLIVPQNCAPLFTDNGEITGVLQTDFLSAINGVGYEGISYGNDRYGVPRPEKEKAGLIDLLDLGKSNGLSVLAVDYCSGENKTREAFMLDEDHGFLGFAAESFALDTIPAGSHNANTKDIKSLDDAENWLILLNPEKYSSKDELISALAATEYDILVIDAFFDTDDMLGPQDTERLKWKASGGSRLVIAYLSIGEAEDYRYYWKEEYDENPPEWMLGENPRWEGNYPVKYWDENWRDIIATGDGSYLSRILKAGFDGVYLDIVDAYETFEGIE